jgi:uncharacterized 2Fe-2S/4Fe-4S cluster protein (DUF4445 family)
MTNYTVTFHPDHTCVTTPVDTLLHEAARSAGIDLNMPCGGQGRCGRCAVVVENGMVRRRSSLRLSADDVARGYALACQTLVEGDVVVTIPAQEKIERRLTTDKTARTVTVPFAYNPQRDQGLRAHHLVIEPPSLHDQTDDWSRLQRALRQQHGIEAVTVDLALLRTLPCLLRDADWQVTAIVETEDKGTRLIDVRPGNRADRLFGVAIDIGTTSNVLYLVDLTSGEVVAQAADYNGQIVRGEDVISRILYARKNGGLAELQELVLNTLNGLLEQVCRRAHVAATEIYKAVVAGNSTMIHLLLGISPESIRLVPFITVINQPPPLTASVLGLAIHPGAIVDCLPGVASYVGADITAGVVSSGLAETEVPTLFMDIGTNGETVLGNRDWLITCACSAGPAFEGAGVEHGMRATGGAIEEIWINSQTYQPTYRVIGGQKPRGICGSGLIALLAELFITGVLDKSGNLRLDLDTPRVRQGSHGPEYVVAWAGETDDGTDIVITKVDVDNLLRAKAAIYAGYTVLCESVGMEPDTVEQVLIGGAFGQYLNVEKAIQIGLLPDLPWDRFQFMGNTSVQGAYRALLSRAARKQIADTAARMTYLELSADNTFYHQFTSALFLPHTDIHRFPSVQTVLANGKVTDSELVGTGD